ncbi:MAG: CoA transferase [Pseudomonadota bacterium]
MTSNPDASDASTGPLQGFRVIELGSMVAGPFCGRLMADFGAEVIKVEPRVGDPMRFMGHRKNEKSLYAASILRNKELVSIDLRTDEGQEVVRRLVARSDVVIENFRPGTVERWNLGYEDLRAINPGIVMVRISGFGQTGKYRSRPGYGIVGESVSGLRDINGDPDRPPARAATSLTDYISGLYGAFGAMMALLHRQRTGQGQVVDTALCEAAFSFMEPHVPAFDALGVVAKRAGSRLPNNVPNNLYPAKDGYIHIAAVSKPIFKRFAELMGQGGMAEDPRFSTPLARNENCEELEQIIIDWTSGQNVAELEEALIEADVPAARVYSVKDIFEDPYFRERKMILDVPDAELGTVALPGVVPHLTGTPGAVRWAGRGTGENTVSVLSELGGYTSEEIEALEHKGVVSTSGVR